MEMGCGLLAVSMHATLDRENFAAMVVGIKLKEREQVKKWVNEG